MITVKTFVNGDMSANCYAVECGGNAVIIDPGYMTGEMRQYITENAEKIRYILLTHRHFDHLSAAPEAKELCGAEIVISGLDEAGLYDRKARLGDLGVNYAEADPGKRADIKVSDRDVINAGSFEIEVVSTPGHTPGGVCYLIGDCLFSGDTLFCSSVGRSDLPEGNVYDLFASLRKLKNMFDGKDIKVFPGHGITTDMKTEIINNPYIKRAML